jgi:photosystem II stability/assembly factor-like uncharacterized protein
LAVSFVDADTGWVVGASQDYRSGIILHTTDGGISWTPQVSPTDDALLAVNFVDANIGTAVGAYGTILRTIDGGATWTRQDFNPGWAFSAVFFKDANTGWAVGSAWHDPYSVEALLLRTQDGGTTWTIQSSDRYFGYFKAVSFVDANTGWVGSTSGIILRTTDGGATWTPQHDGAGPGARAEVEPLSEEALEERPLRSEAEGAPAPSCSGASGTARSGRVDEVADFLLTRRDRFALGRTY